MDTDPLPASPMLGLITLSAKAIEFMAPPDWAAWAVYVIIAGFCLICSAFVSGSEIAYFGLTPSDIDELREDEENSNCKKALRMIGDSERLLATILITNNLVNITMVILLTFAIDQTIQFNSILLSFLLQTVFLTLLLLIFGEILPKLVAKSMRMKWVKSTSPILLGIFRFFKPLAKFMVRSSSLINHFVIKKHNNISTDQLETALGISDVREGKDKEMLEGILTFGDKQVSDIMTSRVDITAIEYHDKWSNVIHTIIESGYSRIPVYETSQDTIRGILYSKDLLPYLSRDDEDFDWQRLLREPYFVPESRMIDDLLEDFRRRKIHIAVVIDEYGCTQGIVTLEDILEEIVGEIDDEYDEDEVLYKRLNSDTYVFKAKIPVVDFCRIVDVDEEELGEMADDAETLAGLLLEIKGDFPVLKEKLKLGRLRFEVLSIEKHRIIKVRVKVLPPPSDEDDDKKD